LLELNLQQHLMQETFTSFLESFTSFLYKFLECVSGVLLSQSTDNNAVYTVGMLTSRLQ